MVCACVYSYCCNGHLKQCARARGPHLTSSRNSCAPRTPDGTRLSRQEGSRQEARRRLSRTLTNSCKPAPARRGATSPSSSWSPTGRAGRGRGPEVRPHAPHRPLRAHDEPCHPLLRSRTARRPHPPSDPLSPLGRSTPLPHLFRVCARAREHVLRGGAVACCLAGGWGVRALRCRAGGFGASIARAAPPRSACARRCSACEKKRVPFLKIRCVRGDFL